MSLVWACLAGACPSTPRASASSPASTAPAPLLGPASSVRLPTGPLAWRVEGVLPSRCGEAACGSVPSMGGCPLGPLLLLTLGTICKSGLSVAALHCLVSHERSPLLLLLHVAHHTPSVLCLTYSCTTAVCPPVVLLALPCVGGTPPSGTLPGLFQYLRGCVSERLPPFLRYPACPTPVPCAICVKPCPVHFYGTRGALSHLFHGVHAAFLHHLRNHSYDGVSAWVFIVNDKEYTAVAIMPKQSALSDLVVGSECGSNAWQGGISDVSIDCRL